MDQISRHGSDRNVSDIPRPQGCLKYMLRVHLQVTGVDFKKNLKHVMDRPFVLVALLNFLIGRNYEVFRGKGVAQELREKMRAAVEIEYPGSEKHLPECDRVGKTFLCRKASSGITSERKIKQRIPKKPTSGE